MHEPSRWRSKTIEPNLDIHCFRGTFVEIIPASSLPVCGSGAKVHMQNWVAGSPDRLWLKRESRLFRIQTINEITPLKQHRVGSSYPCCVFCACSESAIVNCFRVTRITYHGRKSETTSRILVRMLFYLTSLPLDLGFAR